VNSKKIQQKKTPSGQIKFNINDYIHKNKHDSVYLNEKMEKLTEIIDKPKMTVKEAFDKLKKNKEGFEKLIIEDLKKPKKKKLFFDKLKDVVLNSFSPKREPIKTKDTEFKIPKKTKANELINDEEKEKLKTILAKKKRGRPPGRKNKFINDDDNNNNNNKDDDNNQFMFTDIYNKDDEPIPDPNDYGVNLENLNDSSMNIGLMNSSGGSLIDNNQNDDQFMTSDNDIINNNQNDHQFMTLFFK
jgi:hypothetical protein